MAAFQITKSEIRKEKENHSKKCRIHFEATGNAEPTTKELKALLTPALVSASGHELLPGTISIKQVVASAKFSQKAGCSCGCSPGFIVDGMDGFIMFVDVKQI